MSDIIPSKQVAEQAIAGMAELARELNELRAFKAGVPWEALVQCASGAGNVYGASSTDINAAFLWLDANTPKEAGE